MERLKTAGNGGASRASDQFEIIHLNTALKIGSDYAILVVHNTETTRLKYSQNMLGGRAELTRVQEYVNWRLKELTLLGTEREHIMLHCPLRVSIQLLKHYILFNIIPLNTKRRLLYLKTQFVPRSKHFSTRL